MIQLTTPQKKLINDALMLQRKNFDGTDEAFAQSFDINYSVFSRLKNETNFDGLLRDSKWMDLAYILDVDLKNRGWKIVKTDVYAAIEEEAMFCQQFAKSRIIVDNSDIGKSTALRHLAKVMKNTFYIDMSQCPGKYEFIRKLAKLVGINPNDKIATLRAKTKFMLRSLPNATVFIDEAGDMEYKTFLTIKEYWNGTEGECGWLMVGADALREWIDRGKKNKRVGFYEIFNRFGANYTELTPKDEKLKISFYKKLATDVVRANIKDKGKVSQIVNQTLIINYETGDISGLRRIDSLILLNEAK